MDRWGVLRRFGQPGGQVNTPASAAEVAAEEAKREEVGPPRPLPPPAERPREEGDYRAWGAMPPQNQKPLFPPLQLPLPVEQAGNVAPAPPSEHAPVVGISGKREAVSWAVVARTRGDSNKGDYLGIESRPRLAKVLARYGDSKVLFADKILKFTGTGKAKRRGLVITGSAMYLIDPDTDAMKRRIVLAAVDRLCLSELTDHFLALIVPSEYDCLLASTRKKEIAQVVAEATGNVSGGGVEITFSNSFEYRPSVQVEKRVVFQDFEGEIKTRILRKPG